MAFFARSSSSSVSLLFIAMNAPPCLTSGSDSSASTLSCATARETAKSYCSRCFAANSSARACTASISDRFIASMHPCKKRMRFPSESSSVNSQDGHKICSGMPGKPAPQPTSTTDFFEKSAACSRDAQSSRCFSAISFGSVMRVRFMTLLVSSMRAVKSSSWAICASETDSFMAEKPFLSNSVILFLLFHHLCDDHQGGNIRRTHTGNARCLSKIQRMYLLQLLSGLQTKR